MSHQVEETTNKQQPKFLLPVLLALASLALILYFVKSCNGGKTLPATGDSVVTNSTSAITAPSHESIKVKLPDGTELDAFKGGIEDKLVTFLNTDYKKLGADSLKKVWFDFDNLNFKTGSAEITPESQKQIDNITAVLKAFPAASIKIGGYTDKTGNEDMNLKLSDERAKAVQSVLDKSGVGKQVPEAKGYGSEFAKFPATAPESDRVKDRHVSVSVRG